MNAFIMCIPIGVNLNSWKTQSTTVRMINFCWGLSQDGSESSYAMSAWIWNQIFEWAENTFGCCLLINNSAAAKKKTSATNKNRKKMARQISRNSSPDTQIKWKCVYNALINILGAHNKHISKWCRLRQWRMFNKTGQARPPPFTHTAYAGWQPACLSTRTGGELSSGLARGAQAAVTAMPLYRPPH